MRYAHDPVAYESEEWSRPDEMALFSLLWSQTRRELDRRPNSRLLDVCCGSGMSLLGGVAHRHVRCAVGIDVAAPLLDFAGSRFSAFAAVRFVRGDAAIAPFPAASFDIIVASSAYHHIEHPRKRQFLAECRRLLTETGCVLMAENVLPPYDDEEDAYDRSVRRLYAAVSDAALAAYPDLDAGTRDMIDENVRLSIGREYEYKVDRRRIIADVEATGFVIDREITAWSHGGELGPSAGNILFVLNPRTPGVCRGEGPPA